MRVHAVQQVVSLVAALLMDAAATEIATPDIHMSHEMTGVTESDSLPIDIRSKQGYCS